MSRMQPGTFIETLITRCCWQSSVTTLALVLGLASLLIFHRPIAEFITRIESIRVLGTDIRLSRPEA